MWQIWWQSETSIAPDIRARERAMGVGSFKRSPSSIPWEQSSDTTKDSNSDQVGLSTALEANSPESFLAKQLDDIAEQKSLTFKQTYLVADEQIVTSEWVIHRNNYKRALLKPRSILNFLQSYHFISRLQARRLQCVPELPRIEIANKQVISIGF